MGAERRATRDERGAIAGALPTFDGPRFAAWLRRWKDAERLEWTTIAIASGLSASIVQQLARGTPQRNAMDRGQTTIDPRITTVARLAHGLQLEFSYVVSKSGLLPEGEVDRWSHFSLDERAELAQVLRDEVHLQRTVGSAPPSPALLEMLDELEATLPI